MKHGSLPNPRTGASRHFLRGEVNELHQGALCKSRIPKATFICAVSSPDPDNGFDDTIRIWRVSVIKEAALNW